MASNELLSAKSFRLSLAYPLMHILALETSSRFGSVAVLEDQHVLTQAMIDPQQTMARAFAPTIATQLAIAGWQPADIDLVAVTRGPGSFTGLRIGITAAKTFAYAVGAEVIGVNTLAAIARRTPEPCGDVWTVLNAQRGQLFAARFCRKDRGDWHETRGAEIMDNDQWLAGLREGDAVTGPGLKPLLTKLPAGVHAMDQPYWEPDAVAVGNIGYLVYQAGARDDMWQLSPFYFRPSAAEEKVDRKESIENS